jgi:multicomponent Na+:H+ antiporter subunit D
MIDYNFLTPGIGLMLSCVLLKIIPKKLFHYAALVFLFLSYLVLYTLDSHCYDQFLFFDERILFIITSIFFLVLFVSIIIFLKEEDKANDTLVLAFLYVGATVSILFTKNLLCIFLFLEIMMVASTLIIFSGRDVVAKDEGLNYFRFHMLGGTLFLAGIMHYYFKHDSFSLDLFQNDSFRDLSSILILLGLFVNMAIPPFSSWLLGGYMVVHSHVGLVLAVCTTKISALLVMKLFAGFHCLIFIGIFTAAYGVIYAIFENNIRRMLLYFILAEIGMILIFIGVGEGVMSSALIFIINDLLCIPAILCSGDFIINVFKTEKFSEIKAAIGNNRWLLLANLMVLLSIASFPFTLGYISKRYLYETEYFARSNWVPYVFGLLSWGITFTICFKFIIFGFFHSSSRKQQKPNFKDFAYIQALLWLCAALLVITGYFLPFFGADIVIIDNFFIKQIQHVLVVGLIFFLSKNYVTYAKDMYASDPNVLYLKIVPYINRICASMGQYLSRLMRSIDLQCVTNLLLIHKNWPTKTICWSLTLSATLLLLFMLLLL